MEEIERTEIQNHLVRFGYYPKASLQNNPFVPGHLRPGIAFLEFSKVGKELLSSCRFMHDFLMINATRESMSLILQSTVLLIMSRLSKLFSFGCG